MIYSACRRGAGLRPTLPILLFLSGWARSAHRALSGPALSGDGKGELPRLPQSRRRRFGTRLHFPDADASHEKIEAFGNSLVVLVDREHPDLSLLLRKPTARIPHTGGERIKPGSPEEVLLKGWIDHLTQLSGADLSTRASLSGAGRYGCGRGGAGCGAPATDPQPVQPHSARSAGRSDRSGESVSAGRFRQRVSQSVARARAFRRCWWKPTVRRRNGWRTRRFAAAIRTV